MKKGTMVILLVTITLTLIGCNNNSNNTKSKVNVFQDGNVEISEDKIVSEDTVVDKKERIDDRDIIVIDEFSFRINTIAYGDVKFISSEQVIDGISILKFYLVNDEGEIVFKFTDLIEDTSWMFYKLKAIDTLDVNSDGYQDIVIIAEFATGNGSTGAEPFPMSGVYFGSNDGFVRIEKVDNILFNSKRLDTIEETLKMLTDVEMKMDE